MNTYNFIVNPAARKGKGQKLYRTLTRWITETRLQAEIHLTSRPGDAEELAAASSATIQVAVGGDGTIQEVANGILGSEKTLAVIPNGSGNDFVKSIGIPINSRRAFECLLAGQGALIDTGAVTCWNGQSDSKPANVISRFFVNGVGIGFDAAVAERTQSIKYFGGFALYLTAVLHTLGRYRAPLFQIQTDTLVQRGKKLLIAVGNGRCAGGGFFLTPTARVDDGSLDVCMIDDLSVPRILAIMPKVMKGRHTASTGVQMTTMKKLHVQAQEKFYVHADGEIVGRQVNHVEVQLHKLSLRVIVGENFTAAGKAISAG